MKTIGMTCAAVLLLAAFGRAQMEMPKPGPEHKKLDMFAGSWVLEGDTKPGPHGGPGGKVTENEKCEWMEGGFFVVCHVDFKSVAMGNGTEISVIGYDTESKGYTYRAFNSWGEFENAKGSLDGDTLTWTSDEKFGKGRFTMKITSPTTYNFTYEMSKDGTTWATIMDGKATRSN
jgi:hypothetical protein